MYLALRQQSKAMEILYVFSFKTANIRLFICLYVLIKYQM